MDQRNRQSVRTCLAFCVVLYATLGFGLPWLMDLPFRAIGMFASGLAAGQTAAFAVLLALGPGPAWARHVFAWGASMAGVGLYCLGNALSRLSFLHPFEIDLLCGFPLAFWGFHLPLWCLRFVVGQAQFASHGQRGTISLAELLWVVTSAMAALACTRACAEIRQVAVLEVVALHVLAGLIAAMVCAVLAVPTVLFLWRLRTAWPAMVGIPMLVFAVLALVYAAIRMRYPSDALLATGFIACGVLGCVLGFVPPLLAVRHLFGARLPALWTEPPERETLPLAPACEPGAPLNAPAQDSFPS